jgi:hypothetical protein
VHNSGKLLILGIVALALLLAAASWLFRYKATHRAAEFWGSNGVASIRDAPDVVYTQTRPNEPGNGGAMDMVVVRRKVSAAPGLTHLRNALLEDKSFEWPASEPPPGTKWPYSLEFHMNRDGGTSYAIVFSADLQWLCGGWAEGATGEELSCRSCRPIAKGLAEMFAEFAAWTSAGH